MSIKKGIDKESIRAIIIGAFVEIVIALVLNFLAAFPVFASILIGIPVSLFAFWVALGFPSLKGDLPPQT